MKTILKVYLSLLLVTLAFAASPGSAWANMAANTQITNAAQLSYNDGTGTQIKTASVTVTVSLVPSAPLIAIVGAPYSTNYAIGAYLDDTFTITATANGPDTYNLSAGKGTEVNNGSTGTVTVTSGSSVVIGATVTIAGSTTTVLNVPYDGTADGIVNGIALNDWVLIGIVERQVTGITENSTTGIATLTLNSAITAPGAGVLVAGEKTVTVRVTAGTIVLPGISVVVPAHLTALSNTDNSKTTTSSDATNTFYSGLATLNKYVRNVPPATDQHTAGATAYTFAGNGFTYYYYLTGTAVNAKPGEVLEYLLVAANSGTGQVTSAVITDNVPTQYVTFKTGSYSGKDFQYWPNVAVPGVSLTWTAASTNDDPAQYITSTLTVNVGGNPPPSLPVVGGTVPSSTTVAVIYQATVNP